MGTDYSVEILMDIVTNGAFVLGNNRQFLVISRDMINNGVCREALKPTPADISFL